MLLIAGAVWDAKTCAEWGAPITTVMMNTCGDGCVTFTPIEERHCIRRKP